MFNFLAYPIFLDQYKNLQNQCILDKKIWYNYVIVY